MDHQFDFDEYNNAFVEALGAAIEAEESEPHILNIPRIKQMANAYQELCALADPSCIISSTLHKPYTSMGVITIETPDFIFEDMRAIQQIVHNASNIEIYPLVDGTLRMSITFHGVAKKIL